MGKPIYWHTKEMREHYKKAGLCIDCQRARGDDGTTVRCRACADKVNAAIKYYRQGRKRYAREYKA